MANESKTPRTEKEIIKTLGLSVQHALSSMKDFARQLETKLANSEKKVFAYKTALEQSESELIDARAEIERKDKLIEQMREALLSALANRHTCTCYDHDVYEQQSCICGAAETYERIKAALAAERGE